MSEFATLCLSLDCEDNMNINQNDYTIISQDGKEIITNKLYFKNSSVLQTCLEDAESKSINLNFSYDLLECVFRYLEYIHTNPPKTIQKPIMDITLKSVVSEWELNFVNDVLERKMLSDLIYVANYLFVSPLLDLCCAKVASLIKNKSKEEIVKIMNEI